MKILYFDIVGGIAGDMAVASLLELGVPLEHLRSGLATLGLDGLEITTRKEERHKISGTRFLVTPPAGSKASKGHTSYREIRELIEATSLPDGAKEISLRIFQKLAEAEGQVHGKPPDEVVFHEVGSWDSIADVVGAALALDYLAPQAIYCSRVPVGAGMVESAHGNMPVPAPATLLLLEGFPIVQGGPAYERTTPTGAALLAATARPAPQPFAYTPERVGIGHGAHDSEEVPNLLRAVLGHTGGGAASETIFSAEANLDDANPEWIGFLMERLLDEGALDVALLPVHMKKNRPGTIIQVLFRPELKEKVLELLFSETTTLGVRLNALERVALPREEATATTPWGQVAGKVTRTGDRVRFSPEYESCRSTALKAKVPLQEVYRAAIKGYEGEDGKS